MANCRRRCVGLVTTCGSSCRRIRAPPSCGVFLRRVDVLGTRGRWWRPSIGPTSDAGPVYAIDGDPVGCAGRLRRSGADAEKFLFWTTAALECCRAMGWAPDVVHVHDWHARAGVAAHYRDDPFWADTAGVLTIHNLGYLGTGGGAVESMGCGPVDEPPAGLGTPAAAATRDRRCRPHHHRQSDARGRDPDARLWLRTGHVPGAGRSRGCAASSTASTRRRGTRRDPAIESHYSAGRLRPRRTSWPCSVSSGCRRTRERRSWG